MPGPSSTTQDDGDTQKGNGQQKHDYESRAERKGHPTDPDDREDSKADQWLKGFMLGDEFGHFGR